MSPKDGDGLLAAEGASAAAQPVRANAEASPHVASAVHGDAVRLIAVRSEVLSADEVMSSVRAPDAGAIALFAGTVRNENDGLKVTLLEYEAYTSMAEKEMRAIAAEIATELPGVRLAVVHRVGALNVGAEAVLCAASAPHRHEAFEACQRLIDRIKERVPIWKREHGPDGPYWVGWEDARCVRHAEGAHHQRSSHDHQHTAGAPERAPKT